MTELDENLRKYIEREAQDVLRRETERRFKDLERESYDYARRLENLEKKAERAEDDKEDTGRHRVESIRAKNKRYEDLVWTIVRLAIIALLSGGVVEFFHRVGAAVK